MLSGKTCNGKRQILWRKLQDDIRAANRQLDGVMAIAGERPGIADGVMPRASSIKIAVLANPYLQGRRGKLKLTDEYTARAAGLAPGSNIMPGLTPA